MASNTTWYGQRVALMADVLVDCEPRLGHLVGKEAGTLAKRSFALAAVLDGLFRGEFELDGAR